MNRGKVCMTQDGKRLPATTISTELHRLGLTEWDFIKECSRSDRCSVNVCPMDPLVMLREVNPRDRETRCPVSRPDRERFFSRLPPERQALLPYRGLLEKEWNRRKSAQRRLASMSPESLARMRAGREKGLKALEEARLRARSISTPIGAAPNTPRPASPTTTVLTKGGRALLVSVVGSVDS